MKTTKTITFKIHASKDKAKLEPDDRAFRGRVVAAKPSRITVEIEIDDDHGLHKGAPVLLFRDSDLEMNEHAARITNDDAGKMRALIRQHPRTSSAASLRELLKRRTRLLRARKAP